MVRFLTRICLVLFIVPTILFNCITPSSADTTVNNKPVIIYHIPPGNFNYPEFIDIRLSVNQPVTLVKFFFLRPGFDIYQMRIMKQSGDSFIYQLDSSTFSEPVLTYYFQIESKDRTTCYPRGAPEKSITVKGILKERIPAITKIQTNTELPLPQLPGSTFQITGNSILQYKLTSGKTGRASLTRDNRLTADTNLQVQSSYKKENFSLQFNSNIDYSNHPLAWNNELGVSHFSCNAKYNHHYIDLGDFSTKGSAFTFNEFSRRGTRYRYKGDSIGLQFFNMSSQQTEKLKDIIPGEDSRMYGSILGYKTTNQIFSLKAIYMNGRDDLGKAGNIAGCKKEDVPQGKVWALVPEIHITKFVTINGEYAHSSYTPDSQNNDTGEYNDEAWKAGTRLSYKSLEISGSYWNIGPEFNSVGNQHSMLFTNDRKGYNLFASNVYKWATFRLHYKNEKENIQANPEKNFSFLKNIGGTITIVPNSSFTMNITYDTDKQQSYAKENKIDQTLNTATRTCSFSCDFILSPSTTFNLGSVFSQIEDGLYHKGDSTTLTITTGGSFLKKKVFTLFPKFSYSWTDSDLPENTFKVYSVYLDAEYFFLPEIMSFSTISSYSYTDKSSGINTEDLALDCSLNFYLSWLPSRFSSSVASIKTMYRGTSGKGSDDFSILAILNIVF